MSVQLSFYATPTFLREWEKAFPTLKDCAANKVALLRDRAAATKTWLRQYDTVHLPPRLGRCIEIDIGAADRLIARIDGADVTFVGIGDHDITERVKNRLTGRERADAVEPPAALVRGPAGLLLPWDNSAESRGGVLTYAPSTAPSWAYYLTQQQETIRDRIWDDIERLNARDKWERGTHLIMGGPGTGKTSILLSLLHYMDAPSLQDDGMWRIGLGVSPQVRRFIEQHTGWDLRGVCDAMDDVAELDVILVDDPRSTDTVKRWIKRGATKNTSRRRPLVVMGFDPLQLSDQMSDAMLNELRATPGVIEHWVTACYRQREVPGRLALAIARQTSGANPYAKRSKKESFSEDFSELETMVHGLSYENPSGWANAYQDATADNWADYALLVATSLAVEAAAQPIEMDDAPTEALLPEGPRWPRCLVVQLDGAKKPEEWPPLCEGPMATKLVDTLETTSWCDEIKGLEYEHVAVFIKNAELRQLLADEPPDSMGPARYFPFRQLRIPFSRARDSIAVFGV